MNIMAVDDERPALRMLENVIKEAVPNSSLACFSTASEALEYAKTTRLDIVFLDINLVGMSGLELAKNLKDIYGKTNIIFVTGYSEYALDAFAVPASGYIMKPADPEAIAREMDRLRHPVEVHYTERVRIKCFGNFGVFVDGKPFLISRAKPKELLAYLVHKQGVAVSTSELSAVLWEDKDNNSSVQASTRKAISQLMQLLKAAGIGNIIHKGWNSIAIDVDKISCDYYDFLNGKMELLNAYTGEYMNEYSWAEFTVGFLNRKIK